MKRLSIKEILDSHVNGRGFLDYICNSVWKTVLVTALIVALFGLAYADGNIPEDKYLGSDWKSIVYNGQTCFVMFSLPGCKHNEKAESDWQMLKERYGTKVDNFYRINITALPEEVINDIIKNEIKANSFPTYFLIVNGHREVTCQGGRIETSFRDKILSDIDSVVGGLDYEKMGKRMEELNKEKKYQKVIDDYEGFADDGDNKSRRFFNEIGFAYMNTKSDWKKAKKYFTQAHSIDQSHTAPMINLAITCLWLKQYQEARWYAQMYLDNDGENVDLAEKILKNISIVI